MAGESAAAVLSKKNGADHSKGNCRAIAHSLTYSEDYLLPFFPTIVSDTGSQPVHVGKHCVKKKKTQQQQLSFLSETPSLDSG